MMLFMPDVEVKPSAQSARRNKNNKLINKEAHRY